jgi:hypothetical protein
MKDEKEAPKRGSARQSLGLTGTVGEYVAGQAAGVLQC